ncbi:hypothetical protein VTL71DRAFT_1970 [Oculimacula yallundae]|uniref:Uncharacterized protein n=1 Tax=Oculimacula yallundae TaxID=86028 RepID=A0ABR4CC96_9HELO
MSLRLLRRPVPIRLPRRTPFSPQIRNSSSSSTNTSPRITRLLTRLPRFMHPYTRALLTAPVSHITAFLILHEITAFVPLVGLATGFHYMGLGERWLRRESIGEGGEGQRREGWFGKSVDEAVDRFGRYFGRKGWFGFEKVEKSSGRSTNAESSVEVASAVVMDTPPSISPVPSQTSQPNEPQSQAELQSSTSKRIENKFHPSERGTRILIEVATAYAITKALMPARILLSVWAAPWFARVVLGQLGRVGRMFGGGGGRRAAGGGMSGAAGTGATGGGVGSWKKG